MSLAARSSAQLKEDLVMRLGCVLVSVAVLASLVFQPPKVKAADALTLAAVDGGTALLAGYLAACGMTPFTSGSNARDIAEAMNRLGDEFVLEEHIPSSGVGGLSFSDWLGTIAFTVSNGVVRFGKDAADKLNQFAAWVAAKYGTKPGVNVVYGNSSFGIPLADGTMFYYTVVESDNGWVLYPIDVGTKITYPLFFSNGFSIELLDGKRLEFYNGSEKISYISDINLNDMYISYALDVASGTRSGSLYSIGYIRDDVFNPVIQWNLEGVTSTWGEAASFGESLSLDVSDAMQEVLDRLTALEEGQSIALDVGAEQSMEIQEILQGILDAILARDLAASAEVVDIAEIPVDPEEPDPPIVIPSGLEELGAALTSRFPFSIPWDVYKGVTLLAAPPKAPYFEVDFFEPIGHLVGGWKGSTKIVLDMSEYEIVGQVCRWTSTIGFCLMLASGTKRLIWTA